MLSPEIGGEMGRKERERERERGMEGEVDLGSHRISKKKKLGGG